MRLFNTYEQISFTNIYESRLNITNSVIKYVKPKKNKEFGRDIAQIMTSVRSITIITKDKLWAKISRPVIYKVTHYSCVAQPKSGNIYRFLIMEMEEHEKGYYKAV